MIARTLGQFFIGVPVVIAVFGCASPAPIFHDVSESDESYALASRLAADFVDEWSDNYDSRGLMEVRILRSKLVALQDGEAERLFLSTYEPDRPPPGSFDLSPFSDFTCTLIEPTLLALGSGESQLSAKCKQNRDWEVTGRISDDLDSYNFQLKDRCTNVGPRYRIARLNGSPYALVYEYELELNVGFNVILC